MGTWGNDIPVAETISIDRQFDADSVAFDERINRLVAEMRRKGVPWIQFAFEHDKWGISAEFWTLDTSGSAQTGDEPFEGFRYHDLADTLEDTELDVRAENKLSVWAARVLLLRKLSKPLTLGVGLHTAELDNRRNETLNLATAPLFFPLEAVLETDSKSSGTLVGPSVALRGSGKIGGRATVRFTAAQSILFASFEDQSKWQSTITFGGDFLPDKREILTLDSSTRVAIPVTDARALLSFDLGSHVSVGVLGLLSIWFDAPLALQFSQATEGWNEASSTLVFASVGPTLTVRF